MYSKSMRLFLLTLALLLVIASPAWAQGPTQKVTLNVDGMV
ncbi:MAG: hypothetical protein ACE5MB_02035 [Anaerolineae bacterium]